MTQWKRATILPLAKVNSPCVPADYRPISITSVLSRIIERYVVKSFIYPALIVPPPFLRFVDQFAFRPTGSCTAALISLLQKVTALLATNECVHIIALNFSKAFDSVRHVTIMDNFAQLEMPDDVYNWIVDFFHEHMHCTKFGYDTSSNVNINASVIQGSAIGPASFVVGMSDLTTTHANNVMSKYADDLTLIIPSSHSHTCKSEIAHIKQWPRARTSF